MVSEVATSTSVGSGIRYICAAVLAVSFLALVASIMQIGVIPPLYLWVGLPLYALGTASVVWGIINRTRFTSKRAVRITLLVAAIALTGVNIYLTSTARAFTALISSVQTKPSSYVEYAIIAHKQHGASLDTARSIASIATDPLQPKLASSLQHELSAAHTATNLAEIKNHLTDGSLQLAAIRKATLPIIEEADKAFYDTVVVLHTIRIEGEAGRASTAADITKPYILYVSGIDTAGKISTVSRSDVNMLMVVNPIARKLLIINTPRDYYVQLHGTAGLKDKLTHAGVYGIDTSLHTLEDLYGATIHHYVRINFTSLVTLLDTIGPIDVYSEYDFLSYRKGYNTLNSQQALEFARERYSFTEGDRQRGRNQQRVVEAIVAKLSRTENAVKLPQITTAIRNAVETDLPEASLKAMIRQQLDDIRPWKTELVAVDGAGTMAPTYSYGATNLYVMVPSEASLGIAKQKIAEYMQQ